MLLFECKERVFPFYHDLGLEMVGLIGNWWIVEQLLPLVVEQLLNPIPTSCHVSKQSLEEDEVTHIPSDTSAAEDAAGFAKTFPDIPCMSQMLGGPSLRLGIPKERPSIQPGI